MHSYMKTAMAHASGAASDEPITGSFHHQKSAVDYSVTADHGKLWLKFDRGGDPAISGQRELLYFIGSGQVKGRTYLFKEDGFLFESPINWYSQQRVWDMTPNYQNARAIPLNLPSYPECLNCHTSGMQAPEPGTANKYPDPPFAHGGVSCERCHGPGLQHANGSAEMLKLDKLPASRRDAICMQCHLEGDVAVERPHKHVYEFRPGDDLFDYIRYFVFGNKQGIRAVSQFEALAQSACKRASGEKMTCTTCHDPHSTPSAAERVNYYRAKCLTCHGEKFAAKHHPENRDCTSCHMPALGSRDVVHTEATDHRIRRRSAEVENTEAARDHTLVPFPATPETQNDVRDLALAYQTIAQRGDETAKGEAGHLLMQAAKENPNDAAVLSGLGFIEQQQGRLDDARRSYEKALAADQVSDEAATNLGVLEAGAGNLRRAVELWRGPFARAPWRSEIGIDLALAYCAAERFDIAKSYIDRVLEFNPDFSTARNIKAQLSSAPPHCSLN
jgi:predicted CXXCH cytochrome family protein